MCSFISVHLIISGHYHRSFRTTDIDAVYRSLTSNVAYIRHGTESTEANHDQLEHLVNLRIESGYSSSHTLELKEHLDQLQVLYKARKNKDPFGGSSLAIMESFFGNPLKEYYQFVEDMISSKKSPIKKELDT